MKLSYDALQIEGFKSFASKRPAILDLINYGTGLHLLKGRNELDPGLESNGVGKTSLWGALDQTFGIPFDVFTHTILLGQGQPPFFDLPPARIMTLFSTVLNLQRWYD